MFQSRDSSNTMLRFGAYTGLDFLSAIPKSTNHVLRVLSSFFRNALQEEDSRSTQVDSVYHRVDGMIGFFPVVRIGTSPPPHPQASVLPPPLVGGGGGRTHSLAGEGVGGSHFRRGYRDFGILGKYNMYYFLLYTLGKD